MLCYTTQIDAFKTVMEIQIILGKAGAQKLVIDNDTKGNPIALTFMLNWNDKPAAFSLPCNFVGVLKAMRKDKKVPSRLLNEEQALRVGWRIIKEWIAAQMALIQAEVATLAEVFLPYAVTKDGLTLYKQLESNRQMLLSYES